MNVYDILAELEEEVGESKPGLFHKKINTERVAELVESLKNNMPKAVEEASYILSQKDKLLETARADAQAILDDANEKANNLVSQSAVMERAEEEATKMTNLATKRCEQLLDATKNNVDKLLKAVEDYLAEHLNIVHDSRDELTATLIQLKNNLKQ
ncbi:MAG: hypothetical protein IJ542_03925 [Clostridia bacterium]|nr:hypothetical protein [Clostridia bacterium]